MADLYAVVSSRPSVLWYVVGWAEGMPQMVPVGRYVKDGSDVEWRPLPVTAGQVWMPTARGETVIYGDMQSLTEVIEPEVALDGE
jgi:hypothetical protein